MYDRALKINPNDYEAYVNKGRIFLFILGISLGSLGKFDEAITMYDRAMKINPNYKEAYYNSGLVIY